MSTFVRPCHLTLSSKQAHHPWLILEWQSLFSLWGTELSSSPSPPPVSYLLWTVCFSVCWERGPINVVSYEMTAVLLKAVSQTLPEQTDSHLPPSPPPSPTPQIHHIHHPSLSISPVTTVHLLAPTTLTAGLQWYNPLFLFHNSLNHQVTYYFKIKLARSSL